MGTSITDASPEYLAFIVSLILPDTLVDYSYKGTFVSGRAYKYLTNAVANFTPQYDDFGRITHSTTENASGDGVDFEYPLYNKNGNIMSQVYHHRNQQTPPANGFTYDPLNRLTKASYCIFSPDEDNNYEEFNYDLLGNRSDDDGYIDTRPDPDTSCDYTHNLANEYTTVCGVTVLHDAAGNLKRDKNNYSYDYDYENRLTYIYIDANVNGVYNSGTDTLKATFEYDALGRRIEKVITGSPTTTTRFYYDDQRIVLQTTIPSGGSETDEKYFIFGNYIDEVLVMHNLTGENTGDFYYGHDHLYSPTALFESDGDVVERYEYDVYGAVRILTSGYSPLTSSQHGNPYTFTGRELDSVDNNGLKLMYYRARSYDPASGRFLQRDPLGVNPAGGQRNLFAAQNQYKDGANMYEYIKCNPIYMVDSLGLSGYYPIPISPSPYPGDSKNLDLDKLVEDMIASLMESTNCAGSIDNLISCEAACIGDCMEYQNAHWAATLGIVPNAIPPILTGNIKDCCPVPRKIIKLPGCVPNTSNWQNAFLSLSPEAKELFRLKFFKVLGRLNVGLTAVTGLYDSWSFGYCSTWCQDNPGKKQYNPNVPIKWW